jgi:hypothetical protein
VLNEAQIKAAVIDRLYATGALSNAVLINEMVVGNWSRRADLAVANGKLHAFEIKSDLDTLRRLKGQVETYLDRFDKVTVVITSRFSQPVQEQIDERVELWEVSENDGACSIKILRRGRTSLIADRRILAGYLLKTELALFLTSRGLRTSSDLPRREMIELFETIPLSAARKFVLSALKSRYQPTFTAFDSARIKETKTHDLSNLSKSYLKKVSNRLVETCNTQDVIISNARKLNLAELSRKYGILPDNMPTMVLARTREV